MEPEICTLDSLAVVLENAIMTLNLREWKNAVVNLSAPDYRAGKCVTGNIGKSNVWKTKFVIMLCDRQ